MKKVDTSDDFRSEYSPEDLKDGVRGKHLKAYQAGSNLILLSPDVAEVFPTDEAVNNALRSLMEVARRTAGLAKRSSRRTRKCG